MLNDVLGESRFILVEFGREVETFNCGGVKTFRESPTEYKGTSGD